jgi:hypothetical protein
VENSLQSPGSAGESGSGRRRAARCRAANFRPVKSIRSGLERARTGTVKAVKAPAKGAARAAGAVRDGFSWAGGGVRSGVGKATGGTRAKLAEATRGQRVSALVEGVRRRPRYAIAIAAAALLGVAWIAWAIYVTANNGAAAGLGVLLSWPVLLGALALVAAPFVLTAMLVQRHRSSTPAIAGAPGVSDPPKPKAEKKPEAEEKEPEAEEKEPEPEEKEPEPEEDPAASSA